jgi:hypothetical protein
MYKDRSAVIQAIADVHPGRDRRSAGPLTHATAATHRRFRTRSHEEQFVVVALKEGLFMNANVLFRMRFRDGTSGVERTGQGSHSLYNHYERELVTGGGPSGWRGSRCGWAGCGLRRARRGGCIMRGLNGFPFAGQHTEAEGGTAEAGREREVSTERRADGNAGARFVHV